jgi:RNA polymerase sigma factor (sigma-70 family)
MVEPDVGGVTPPGSLGELGDVELMDLVRGGNEQAYGVLYARYSYSAYRLARHLGQREDSDDVVSEAFARLLSLLKQGKGPSSDFRAYLFTTIRHESASRTKFRSRVTPTDDTAKIDSAVEFGAGQMDHFERTTVRAAYESLPPRWRSVLWHIEVEGKKPLEVSSELELSANSISALVYRARAALREAYVQQHANLQAPTQGPQCESMRLKFSALVRGTVSERDRRKLTSHVQGCHACMIVLVDLADINQGLGSQADKAPPDPVA